MNWKSLFPGTVNAVNGRLSRASSTCQYPLLRSSVIRYFAPHSLSSVAVICGRVGVGRRDLVDTAKVDAKSVDFVSLPHWPANFTGSRMVRLLFRKTFSWLQRQWRPHCEQNSFVHGDTRNGNSGPRTFHVVSGILKGSRNSRGRSFRPLKYDKDSYLRSRPEWKPTVTWVAVYNNSLSASPSPS